MGVDLSPFAMLALAWGHRQYPNKIAPHLNLDAGLKPPRELTPRIAGTREFEGLLRSRSSTFFLNDRDGPLGYEPSGEDFLSPSLAEADLMRRFLMPAEFAVWLKQFLPGIPADGGGGWLKPGVVT